ncbi:hypothetical protein ABZ746_24920 [Streptomyces sp. NPDC020096]
MKMRVLGRAALVCAAAAKSVAGTVPTVAAAPAAAGERDVYFTVQRTEAEMSFSGGVEWPGDGDSTIHGKVVGNCSQAQSARRPGSSTAARTSRGRTRTRSSA